jgi:hypothetical protein
MNAIKPDQRSYFQIDLGRLLEKMLVTQFTKMLAAKTTTNDTHQCFKTQRASAFVQFGMSLY